MKFTLKNDFHNTEVTVNARKRISDGIWWISAAAVKKAQKTLCGVDGCSCGDFIGARGHQDCEYEENWQYGRNNGTVFYETEGE